MLDSVNFKSSMEQVSILPLQCYENINHGVHVLVQIGNSPGLTDESANSCSHWTKAKLFFSVSAYLPLYPEFLFYGMPWTVSIA